MEITKFNSSIIKSAAYTEQALEVHFCDGAVYWYFGVPKGVYEAFLKAKSKGRYFVDFIKPKYQMQIIKQKDE